MNLAIPGGQQPALPPQRIFATSGASTAPGWRNEPAIAGNDRLKPAQAGLDAGTPPDQRDDRRCWRQAVQASPGRLLRQACQPLLAAALALLALAAGAQEAPLGDLKTLGSYPLWRQSHSVTPLADGRYFLHGAQPIRYNPGKPQDNPVLRERRRASTSLADGVAQVARDSWLWLPERKGWKRLGDMPECPVNAYLQAVTPLAGGDVLLTGGLCDAPKMGDDPTEHPLYLHSSHLNGKTLQWEASPDLHEGRLFHTATAFPDGSVLVVGGQRDPALNPAAFPVLASVERLQAGAFTTLAPLAQGRAGHSATLLDAGHLLVCGGFDALGEALASVELWDAASQRWQPLPPLRTARHGHSATRLADGRVLIAGGFDGAGQPLRSSEIWDPARSEWLPSGVLSAPVGRHRAALLAGGDVLLVGEMPGADSARHNFGHLWRALGNTWLPAAPFESDGAPEPRFVPSIAPQPDGSAVVFGRDVIWRWQAHNTPAAPPAPRWQGAATLVRTGDAQVMLLAADAQTPAWRAYLWDERGNWRAAGRLAHARMGRTAAVLLRSGRVLHLAEEDANRLHCELSPPGFADQDWEDCAGFTPEYVVESPAGLGLLADGRAVALVNMSDAFIFDENARRWTAGKLEWHTTGLAFGTPVRGEAPLARVRDAAGTWHDISALGARFWGQAGARVDHDIVSNGKVIRSVSGRGQAPAMLWNPQRGYWDYIFPDHSQIGRTPEILPDGCAVSIQPPSLFDPKSGVARRLTGQLSDISEFDNSMVALADGTLVIASAAHGGIDSQVIFSRASCAGLAERGDDRFLMPAEFARDLPAPVAAPKAPAAPPELPAGQRWRAYLAALPAGVWIAPALLVLLAILRWRILPALQRRHALESPRPAAKPGRGERLHQPVPVAWRRGLRIVFYGVALFLIVPPLFHYMTLRLGEQAQACAESSQACLDPQSGLLRSVPSLARQGSGATAQPHIPCRHVGSWSSRNDYQIRRITLRDDGTYQMAAMIGGADRRAQYTGRWMVQAGHMVWRDEQAVQELDINRIESESEGVFTLIEGNGSRTRFERIDATPSSRCLP